MRTGRALTISGGGASQKQFFGGKEIEKKEKKFRHLPPENFRHPPKISDTPPKIQTPPENFRHPQTPPKNFRHPQKNFRPPQNSRHPPANFRPPRNFQAPPKISDTPKIPDTPRKTSDTPPDQARYPPHLPVDRQTPVNLLPWPNFVAAGNDKC